MTGRYPIPSAGKNMGSTYIKLVLSREKLRVALLVQGECTEEQLDALQEQAKKAASETGLTELWFTERQYMLVVGSGWEAQRILDGGLIGLRYGSL